MKLSDQLSQLLSALPTDTGFPPMGYEAAEDAKERLWPLCREIHDLHWQFIQKRGDATPAEAKSHMEMEQDLGPRTLKSPDAFLTAARRLENYAELNQRSSGGKKGAKTRKERSAIKAKICCDLWSRLRGAYDDNRSSIYIELTEQWEDLLDNYDFICDCPTYETFCGYLREYISKSVQP